MRIPWGCRGNPQNGDWDSNETMLIEKKKYNSTQLYI